MEFHFTLKRILVFLGLLGIFALLGGFVPPDVRADSMLSSRRVTRAWFYCMLMFLSGATCATVVDHFVGTLDRSNIRLLYIIVGVLLMIAASLWIRAMRSAYEKSPAESEEMSRAKPAQFFAPDPSLTARLP